MDARKTNRALQYRIYVRGVWEDFRPTVEVERKSAKPEAADFGKQDRLNS